MAEPRMSFARGERGSQPPRPPVTAEAVFRPGDSSSAAHARRSTACATSPQPSREPALQFCT
jgi:hypothetical protein